MTESNGGPPPEAELTPEARRAILKYMLKFVIPSGVVLAVVSGIGGYVVSGLARIDATSEAAKVAPKAVQDSSEAKAIAATAALNAKTAQEKIEGSAEKAEATAKHVLNLKDQVEKMLGGQYDNLAKSLAGIKEFRDSLQQIPQIQIREFQAKFDSIDRTLYESLGDVVTAPGNSCPSGTYAVGVTSVSVSGGAHGFLESVTLKCRALRFEKPK